MSLFVSILKNKIVSTARFQGAPRRLCDANKPNDGSSARGTSTAVQLASYRQKMKKKHRRIPKVMTLDMLAEKKAASDKFRRRAAASRVPAVRSLSDLSRPDVISAACVKFTNEFRAAHDKPPVEFDPALIRVGQSHSDGMAAGRVAVGHAGFSGRAKQIQGRSAENVAMMPAGSGVARMAVDGWIASPGHRRNLLGPYRFMGVSVAAGGEHMYLTQLFKG